MLTLWFVNVISKPGLLRFAKKHPETLRVLALWYKIAKKANWHGLHEVRREHPSADQVGDVLIFDVLGGNFRLITRVSYQAQRIYVKALLNHGEYDRKEWMKWA
jgi:mRNA interferase HigB